MTTLRDRLDSELDHIVQEMDAILESEGSINHVSHRSQKLSSHRGAVVVPDGAWGKLDAEHLSAHRRLLERWRAWVEQVQLLFAEEAPRRRKKIDSALERARDWVDRSGGQWSIPATPDQAREAFRKKLAPLREALASVAVAQPATFVVPDTNVLLRSPDVATYDAVLGTDRYTVVLCPGVLGELDAHKTNHRNEAVREKARKVSSRIKGWRKQGKLSDGVRVKGEVFVRVVGKEPDFTRTLSWLQPDIVDDRIIATVLEIQRRRPGDRVVVLTGDTLMLAKADAASIPTADTPAPDL